MWASGLPPTNPIEPQEPVLHHSMALTEIRLGIGSCPPVSTTLWATGFQQSSCCCGSWKSSLLWSQLSSKLNQTIMCKPHTSLKAILKIMPSNTEGFSPSFCLSFFVFKFSWDKVSLYGPGSPETHSVSQAVLEFVTIPSAKMHLPKIQSLFKRFLFHFIYLGAMVQQGVEMRGQLTGVSSLLPSCKSWGLNRSQDLAAGTLKTNELFHYSRLAKMRTKLQNCSDMCPQVDW